MLHVRAQARAMGVRGALPYLNEMACGKRGYAAPSQLHRFAVEMRRVGLSQAAAESALMDTTREIVALAYQSPGQVVRDVVVLALPSKTAASTSSPSAVPTISPDVAPTRQAA